MKLTTAALFSCLTVSLTLAQDVRQLSDAFQQGRTMGASDAEKLETRLSSNPQDIPGHIRLIAFYTFGPEAPASERAVIRRRKHLLWMAEHEPESWLWSQRSYASAVYVKGDRLADPDGFAAIREQWLKHLSRDPSDERIRANAASFLALGDRETAVRLIREMRNSRYLGTEYALLLLGVTARDYDSGIPVSSDAGVRQSELAAHALAELNNSSDPDFIGGAGFWLARDGAILWSQGKLDWDYSSVAKNLLKRARELEPNRIDWLVANPELPRRGEQRPIMAVRIGGPSMKTKLLQGVQPDVPAELQDLRGTVLVDIAVDGAGNVMAAVPKSGPPDLYTISLNAVKQWRYRPTTLNGSPVIVMTTVEFRYE